MRKEDNYLLAATLGRYHPEGCFEFYVIFEVNIYWNEQSFRAQSIPVLLLTLWC